MKLSQDTKAVLSDQTIVAPGVTAVFPLSSASQPSNSQTFTIMSFNQSPFPTNTIVNQTMLTENTIYFSYRDSKGGYLDNSNIMDFVRMNFTLNMNLTKLI